MMETQAPPLRRSQLAALLAHSWASRLLATLGAVLMTVGLFVPVVGRDLLIGGDPASRFFETWTIGGLGGMLGAPLATLHMSHMPHASLIVALGFDAVYSVLEFGGLALIPPLWLARSTGGVSWTRRAFAAWLALLSILAIVGALAWRTAALAAPTSIEMTVGAPALLPWVVVFPLGVLIGGAGLLLMRREPLPMAAAAPTPRSSWQWVAALTITAGVLIWGVGFYLMPVVITAACPPVSFSITQFAHGACAGLDSDQALAAAYNAGLSSIAFPLYLLGRRFELLVAVALITALGGWTRRLAVATLVWLAAWPVLALGVALVALQGVDVVAQTGFRLTFATGGGWHVAPGLIATFAGIGLVALGQVVLWRELARRSDPAPGALPAGEWEPDA